MSKDFDHMELEKVPKEEGYIEEDSCKSEEEEASESPLCDLVLSTVFCCVPMPVQYFFNFQFESSLPDSMFIEDVGSLPKLWKYLVGIWSNIIYYGILIYFLLTAYESGRTSTFISLQDDAGDCVEIGRPTSGEFQISTLVAPGQNGTNYVWSSSSSYEYNSTFFNVHMISYASKMCICCLLVAYICIRYWILLVLVYIGTEPEFQSLMGTIGSELKAAGDKAPRRDISHNLLHWMTYNSRHVTSGVFEFNTYGIPAVVFNSELINHQC